MKTFITPSTVCAADSCPMSSQCNRYKNYAEALKTDNVLSILNTSLLEIGSEGCKHLHIARETIVARGFKKMYATIPHYAATALWRDFPGKLSRRQFYRLLNGEVELLPDNQAEIMQFLEKKGANTALGFDEVCTEMR